MAQVVESREDANSAAVGRNFRPLDPATVGIFVKIVPGLDRRVHVSTAMPWVSCLQFTANGGASADTAKSADAAARAKVRYGKQEVGLIRLRSKEAAAEHSQSGLDGGQLKRLARLGNLLVGLGGSGKGPWALEAREVRPNETGFRASEPFSATEDTDAIVRVDAVTICGTDLHILKGDVPAVTDGRILGHEAVGTVEVVGSGVKTIKPGDRVLVSCITSCGTCRFCREGRGGQCLGGGGWILGHKMPGVVSPAAHAAREEQGLRGCPATVRRPGSRISINGRRGRGSTCPGSRVCGKTWRASRQAGSA